LSRDVAGHRVDEQPPGDPHDDHAGESGFLEPV
jgi:hypothetical protein